VCSPAYDAAFDSGFISFADGGQITRAILGADSGGTTWYFAHSTHPETSAGSTDLFGVSPRRGVPRYGNRARGVNLPLPACGLGAIPRERYRQTCPATAGPCEAAGRICDNARHKVARSFSLASSEQSQQVFPHSGFEFNPSNVQNGVWIGTLRTCPGTPLTVHEPMGRIF
jgi:hypothetical protein